MRMFRSLLAASALTLAAASPASAELLTLGSTLTASPTAAPESQGADTAFWPATINGAAISVPANGQVVAIRVKGSAMREPNAKNGPANMVHFQTLNAAAGDGSRTVNLTSDFFDMPVDEPQRISEFKPTNLCVNQGGTVAMNTIGGFMWGGSLTAPTVAGQYERGTPWQIFAPSSSSSTAWYSKDNGTNNGAKLTPSGGSNAHDGYGAVVQGKEMLMQVVVATGDDVSFECGGPRRDGNNTIMREMSVNPNQDMYVGRDGSFSILGYCGSRIGDCTGGTVTVTIGGKVVATGAFSVKERETIKVRLALGAEDYLALAAAPNATQDAVVTLTNRFGSYNGAIKLHTIKGGLMAMKAQKPYVANDRRFSPYATCLIPTGCTGTAVVTAKGKTIATKTFRTTKSGVIIFKMKLGAKAFRALKKAKTTAAKLTVTGSAGTASTSLLLRK